MVRDESSAHGQMPHAEPESGTNQTTQPTNGPEIPLGSGLLTQELAQLLAATIAHNQAQRGAGGGVPTGSDLASLAALMSAASAHRTLQPGFKDGLSSLSYAQPHANQSQGPADHGEQHHDDEPMPIPSTWRQPAPSEHDRWFRQQMGAAALGLVAGLMIVIPSVLWLSGLVGGQKPKMASTTASSSGDFAKSPAADIKTVKVQVRPIDRPADRQVDQSASQFVTGSLESKSAAETSRQTETALSIATIKTAPEPQQPTRTEQQPPRVEQHSRAEQLLSQAARRIESGDIAGARELLAGADGQVQGPASFALAETYDPNMLAAWGTRGAVADVAKARALYGKALNLGVSKAQVRLDGLN